MDQNTAGFQFPFIKDEQGRITYFCRPTQILFSDGDHNEDNSLNYIFGIGYTDEIICGCCGGVLSLEAVYEGFENQTETCDIRDAVITLDWLDLDNELFEDTSASAAEFIGYEKDPAPLKTELADLPI